MNTAGGGGSRTYMSFLTELGFVFFILFYNSWMQALGTVPDGKKMPERLVHSLTGWAVDLNPISSVLIVEARGFLGNGETEAGTLRITSVHSSEYWVSYELPSWHSNE